MSKYLVFRKYAAHEEADVTVALLQDNGIDAITEEVGTLLDNNFFGTQFFNPFLVKIKAEDFENAGKILLDNTVVSLADVPENYMLLSFSEEELKDVVAKIEEWGEYNYKLALALLQQHSAPVSASTIAALHQQQLQKDATAKSFDKAWLWLCYLSGIFSLVITVWLFLGEYIFLHFWIFPSAIPFVIGLGLYFGKKTLSNGQRVYSYDKDSRKHGIVLALLGLFSFLARFVFLYWLAM